MDKKIQFIFRLYDVDRDGFISSTDLEAIFRLLINTSIKDDELTFIAKTFINEYSGNKDGRISMDDFTKLISHSFTELH